MEPPTKRARGRPRKISSNNSESADSARMPTRSSRRNGPRIEPRVSAEALSISIEQLPANSNGENTQESPPSAIYLDISQAIYSRSRSISDSPTPSPELSRTNLEKNLNELSQSSPYNAVLPAEAIIISKESGDQSEAHISDDVELVSNSNEPPASSLALTGRCPICNREPSGDLAAHVELCYDLQEQDNLADAEDDGGSASVTSYLENGRSVLSTDSVPAPYSPKGISITDPELIADTLRDPGSMSSSDLREKLRGTYEALKSWQDEWMELEHITSKGLVTGAPPRNPRPVAGVWEEGNIRSEDYGQRTKSKAYYRDIRESEIYGYKLDMIKFKRCLPQNFLTQQATRYGLGGRERRNAAKAVDSDGTGTGVVSSMLQAGRMLRKRKALEVDSAVDSDSRAHRLRAALASETENSETPAKRVRRGRPPRNRIDDPSLSSDEENDTEKQGASGRRKGKSAKRSAAMTKWWAEKKAAAAAAAALTSTGNALLSGRHWTESEELEIKKESSVDPTASGIPKKKGRPPGKTTSPS